jgi:hypothetical protein
MILAVVIAGVAGTIANSVVVAALTPNDFLALAISPGRLIVAIIVAALLPVIYAQMSGAKAGVVAVAALTIIPSLLAKLVFGVGAPWGLALGVNAVYAVVAWAVYLGFMRARPPAR